MNIQIPEYIKRIAERAEHRDTMREPSPLEYQWLEDWETHFADRLEKENNNA